MPCLLPSNPQVLLHTDEQFKYYKVVAATGTEMHSGAVLRVCEAAGMWAVCTGTCGCTHVNTPGTQARCVVTPLYRDRTGCGDFL